MGGRREAWGEGEEHGGRGSIGEEERERYTYARSASPKNCRPLPRGR